MSTPIAATPNTGSNSRRAPLSVPFFELGKHVMPDIHERIASALLIARANDAKLASGLDPDDEHHEGLRQLLESESVEVHTALGVMTVAIELDQADRALYDAQTGRLGVNKRHVLFQHDVTEIGDMTTLASVLYCNDVQLGMVVRTSIGDYCDDDADAYTSFIFVVGDKTARKRDMDNRVDRAKDEAAQAALACINTASAAARSDIVKRMVRLFETQQTMASLHGTAPAAVAATP